MTPPDPPPDGPPSTGVPDAPMQGPTSRRRASTLLGLDAGGPVQRFLSRWGFPLFVLVILILGRSVLLPFVFAALIAYILAPVIRWMTERKDGTRRIPGPDDRRLHLIDMEKVHGFLRSLFPPNVRDDYDVIIVGIDRGLSGVIRGQLVICLINGVLTYIGLLVFGVKYSLILAFVAAAMSLIPIFGALLSTIPIVLAALVSLAVPVASMIQVLFVFFYKKTWKKDPGVTGPIPLAG